jgi:hypothetical protein
MVVAVIFIIVDCRPNIRIILRETKKTTQGAEHIGFEFAPVDRRKVLESNGA